MKARKVKKLDPQGTLGENAARIVRVRLDELRSFIPTALEKDRTVEQHDMRIAAKRLRYILETTEFCFGPAGSMARRRAKDLQEVLGELHDCDVMLPRIERHVDELRRADAEAVRRHAGSAPDLDPALTRGMRHRTSYRGLGVLAVYIEARRRLLFERFRDIWTEQERAGVWDRLEGAAAQSLGRQRVGSMGGRAAED